MESILNHFSNPVRAKILIDIHAETNITAKKLAEKYPEIPQATLYRHLKSLLDEGVIKIAEEHHVRGTIEKVYAIAGNDAANIAQIVEENNGEEYFKLFVSYATGLMREFKNYAERENINIKQDGSGFSVAPVYANQEELKELGQKIGEIIAPLYNNKDTTGRKLYNLCLITTPPSDN